MNICPNCKGINVKVKREVGCFWIVFFFVSCGLGLIMYPFLPRVAQCKDCGNKWKI